MAKEFDTIKRIKDLCKERNYSYYELAKRSNIAYSTLNSMILKNNSPTIPTLNKLCNGFGITIYQFFQLDNKSDLLSATQKECLNIFCILSPEEQQLALAYMRGLAHKI
ncbi:MAG: helix-turn-helix transcriptional regulator [Lachnospiraceae bacterium]|nr:helix-turn-helix transcriptional regulator [Lachnospiraceae bacterium]